MQIELAAFANYALNTFDYSAEFEDDQWAVTFQEVRIFCTRKRHSFKFEIGEEVFELPRY